jgi:hypothetical protein
LCASEVLWMSLLYFIFCVSSTHSHGCEHSVLLLLVYLVCSDYHW